MNICGLGRELRLLKTARDGLDQRVRRGAAQRQINVGKMFAVELVKVAIILRVVLRAIPPVPVAAFSNEQLFKGKLLLLRQSLVRVLGKEIARSGKLVPGGVVFRRPDPDIEVGINPRARKNGAEALRRAC